MEIAIPVFGYKNHISTDRRHGFIRTIGIARARTKIGMANLVYNMRRLAWWEGRTAPA